MKKYDLRPLMKVQCGDFKWSGKAENYKDAIVGAFSRKLPDNPSSLLRVWDGKEWSYINFRSALKIAGYNTITTKNGFKVV